MPFIYSLTSPEGKSYVGQTTKTVPERWRKHVVSSKNETLQAPLMQAIRQFGATNFVVTVLEECKAEELDDRERFHMEQLNTLLPHGYNVLVGGKDGGVHRRRVPLPEESAATVDREALPLFINFMYEHRGYHGFIVRNFSPNFPKFQQKTFHMGPNTELTQALQKAEDYLAQFIPRDQWIYKNKMGATRQNKRYPDHEPVDIDAENASLPQGIYAAVSNKGRVYYVIQDFKKEQRFRSTSYRAGSKTPQECRKLAEDYLAQFIPRDQWKPRRKVSKAKKTSK